jgi:AcrR family transcriptional regulator
MISGFDWDHEPSKNPLMDASAASKPSTVVRPGIAERLWEASRIEFSLRGYHGARVQGIARRAGCNVALLYRHWASKKALYLDVLRTIWLSTSQQIAALMEQGPGGPESVVGAYLDAMLHDPAGAQIFVREYLDGAPFLQQLVAAEPALGERVRAAAKALAGATPDRAARPGLDPTLAVLTIGGLAAFAASAHESSRIFLERPVTPEALRQHLFDLLLHGLLPRPHST